MPRFMKGRGKRGWFLEGYEALFTADLDALLESTGCTVVKDQKRIRVYRVLLRGEPLYIKRYNPYALSVPLEALFRGSKAFRSWKGAGILRDHGIDTAEAVAAVEERRFGITGKSYFITREIEGAEISVLFYEKMFTEGREPLSERRRFIRALASLFRRLHREGIYHNDLKDYNILMRIEGGEYRFFLLDLEGVYLFKTLPRRCRMENLVQIYRTLGRLWSAGDKAAFIREYTGAEDWKDLARDLIEAVRRKDRISGEKRL